MNRLWETTKPGLVPEIDDNELASMAKQIRPLLMHEHRYWLTDTPSDLRGVSYLWDAKPTEYVGLFGPLNSIKIITFHRWGAPVFFKPSIAEVMACIKRYVEDWSEIGYFFLHSDDIGAENIIGDCHWCKCSLFGKDAVK